MFGWKRQTADKHEGRRLLRCSFCNKSQNDVRRLIAGPTVYICDECVDICADIVNHEAEGEHASPPSSAAPDTAFICNLCRLATMPTAAVILPGRGVLCPDCAAAVVDALAGKASPPN